MLIDGKKIAAELKQEIKLEISHLKNKYKNILGTDQVSIKPGSLDGAPGDKVNQI